jgi:predicted CXXCH cytochrome family protein
MTEAEFKHDPAAEGECLECHNPHASDVPFQLRAAGQALCYSCHDEEDITEQEAHQDMGEEDCTTCHDPHQGDREYFLKPLPKKKPGGGA